MHSVDEQQIIDVAARLHADQVVIDTMAPSFITEWVVTDEMVELANRMADQGLKRSAIQAGLSDFLLAACDADPATRAAHLGYWRQAGVDGCSTTLYVSGPPGNAWNDLMREYARASRMVAALRGEVVVARGAADLVQAKCNGKLAVLYNIQNPEPIGDDLDNVDVLNDLGIGIVQMSYNLRNRFADGCLEVGSGGLSRFGRALVEKLNDSRMVVDVAHGSAQTALDAAAASRVPIIASHTAAKALSGHPRAISDETARAIADKGGYIGVVAVPPFILQPGDHRAQASGCPPGWATLDAVVDHVEHFLQVAGEDHVGMGTDWGKPYYNRITWRPEMVQESRSGFDWVGWTPEHPLDPNLQCHGLETWDQWRALTAALLRRNIPERTVAKLIGGNFLRVLGEVRGC